jgi:hypothetical protein
MSRSPQSPSAEVKYDEVAQAPATISTRTVAIIKNHALNNRFDIEPRILEASFEVRNLSLPFDRGAHSFLFGRSLQIVKERQMEFDTETDPDTLYELFGEDADSLAECVLPLPYIRGPCRLISLLP